MSAVHLLQPHDCETYGVGLLLVMRDFVCIQFTGHIWHMRNGPDKRVKRRGCPVRCCPLGFKVEQLAMHYQICYSLPSGVVTHGPLGHVDP